MEDVLLHQGLSAEAPIELQRQPCTSCAAGATDPVTIAAIHACCIDACFAVRTWLDHLALPQQAAEAHLHELGAFCIMCNPEHQGLQVHLLNRIVDACRQQPEVGPLSS